MYYLSCKTPKVLKYDSFIFLLEEISNTEKLIDTSHEKKSRLAKSSVTMTDFIGTFL